MTVTIKTEKQVELENYFLLRGIKEMNGVKAVVREQKSRCRPTAESIAEFILKCGCDFASVVENYEVVTDDFPFA